LATGPNNLQPQVSIGRVASNVNFNPCAGSQPTAQYGGEKIIASAI